MQNSPLVRAIFKGREILLRARPEARSLPRGLLAQTKGLGWATLAEVPGREIVMGAATVPWAMMLVRRVSTDEGRVLNFYLVGTARLLLVYGVLFSVGLAR